jgi:hypothetical protein
MPSHPGPTKAGGAGYSHEHANVYHGHLKERMRHFHGVATKNPPSYLSRR